MIVVAIIGVLSTIALPNYQKMAGKARQVEAKNYVSSIYTVEKTFFAENSTYTYCLFQGGFEQTPATRRFYLAGFQSAVGFSTATTTLFDSGAACLQGNVAWGGTGVQRNDAVFEMNAWSNPTLAGAACGLPTSVTSDTFYGEAYGSISPVGIWDIWTIDQNRVVTNIQPGI